ncbi:MAG: hypothetical protein DLM59_00330, partial [Pseudonocardiales bacterium]
MTDLAPVFARTRAPGVYRWPSRAHPAAVARKAARHGWTCSVLDGRRITDRESLLAACATALSFPAYFAHTWDGLATCLADLSWLPPAEGRLVVYDDCGVFARADPADCAVAIDVLAASVAQASPALYVL